MTSLDDPDQQAPSYPNGMIYEGFYNWEEDVITDRLVFNNNTRQNDKERKK